VFSAVKKNVCILLLSIYSLSLSACSLEENVEHLYREEKPLEAEIVIPDSFSEDKQEIIEVILTQDGKKVEGADFVHFEIWKQDGSLHYSMEEAVEVGKGMYLLRKNFDSHGLYYIKIHAGNNGSIIMPTKQFTVGELSKSELEFLQKDLENPNTNHEHHH
jgi:hypothetical protein